MYSTGTWTTHRYLESVQNPRLDCSIYFILKDTSTHIYSLFLANKCTKIYTLNEKTNHAAKSYSISFLLNKLLPYVAKCLNTTVIKCIYFTIHSLICPSYMYNNFYYFQFTSLNCSFLLLFAAFGRLISGVTLTYIIGRCAASTNQVCALHFTVQ